MPVIRMSHPEHGVAYASTEDEALGNEANGWVRDSGAPVEPRPAVFAEEVPRETVIVKRGPGRPRKYQ